MHKRSFISFFPSELWPTKYCNTVLHCLSTFFYWRHTLREKIDGTKNKIVFFSTKNIKVFWETLIRSPRHHDWETMYNTVYCFIIFGVKLFFKTLPEGKLSFTFSLNECITSCRWSTSGIASLTRSQSYKNMDCENV